MRKKILKICFSSAVIVLLSSCSLAGSWVYERLDDYLADYFKEFADFSDEQRQEIQIVSEEFLNWFSENEPLSGTGKIKLGEAYLKINENELLINKFKGEKLFHSSKYNTYWSRVFFTRFKNQSKLLIRESNDETEIASFLHADLKETLYEKIKKNISKIAYVFGSYRRKLT